MQYRGYSVVGRLQRVGWVSNNFVPYLSWNPLRQIFFSCSQWNEVFATQRSSQLLTGLIYPWIIRILSVCLYVFGAIVWLTNQFIKPLDGCLTGERLYMLRSKEKLRGDNKCRPPFASGPTRIHRSSLTFVATSALWFKTPKIGST